MVLQVDPSSPVWMHAAAATVLYLHIGGGAVGLVSGFAALTLRKGSRPHRLAGNVFFVSMLIMAAIGGAVAPLLPERISSLAGWFTVYLVATSWVTIRRPPNTVGHFETFAFVFALGLVTAAVLLGREAAAQPDGLLEGLPYQIAFTFGALAALAAALDLRVIVRRGIAGAQRLARHLWRMCLALVIAAGSLFFGQPQVFPEPLRDSALLAVPVFVPLFLLFFWLVYVFVAKRFRGRARTA